VLPAILNGYWVGLIAQGLVFGIVFLSYTLLAGEVGMISLCQISFAGIGGVVAAQLASMHGWPVLPAILIGGVAAMPVGAVIGFLTLRMGDLYVALVTFTFGLLMDNMVFSLNAINQQGAGVALGRPGFASGDQAFAYLALVVFCVFALLVARMRRSTIGMAFAGVRWSETASRTLGVNVVAIKIFAFALSAFIAAIGGGMLASYYGAALSANYSTLIGLVYIAVVVTTGVMSPTAAMLGGIVYSIVPALFTSYLPNAWSPAPAALFGLGGILAAKQPDGWVPTSARAIQALARAAAARVRFRAVPGTRVGGPGSAAVMDVGTVMDAGVSEGRSP
jgi:branched-chain amino acid transport system permease protein